MTDRLAVVRKRMALAAEQAGRSLDRVQLVAVTKTIPAARIREAFACGVRAVGENRVQEALEKQAELSDLPLEWHLIGHLQTNKVKQVVGRFALIHSVDSMRLLHAIDQAARAKGIRQDILLQVNVAEEPTKFGFRIDAVPEALQEARRLAGVTVRGFMTIAPYVSDPEEVRWVFRRLAELAARERRDPSELAQLSMGMSSDYPMAIAEGATLVRIGTGIFGERPGRPGLDEEAT
ncbi:MAG TPA: YggS family pyridoxal phosphate-dependent enzyme [Stenomitos sp.]